MEMGEGAQLAAKRDISSPGVATGDANSADDGLMFGVAAGHFMDRRVEVDRVNNAVSMSRGARDSFPCLITTELVIICRINGGPMIDFVCFVGFSITSQSAASEGPAGGGEGSTVAKATVETEDDATEPPLGEDGGGLTIFFVGATGRGFRNPSTFQAFLSSSLLSGKPQ